MIDRLDIQAAIGFESAPGPFLVGRVVLVALLRPIIPDFAPNRVARRMQAHAHFEPEVATLGAQEVKRTYNLRLVYPPNKVHYRLTRCLHLGIAPNQAQKPSWGVGNDVAVSCRVEPCDPRVNAVLADRWGCNDVSAITLNVDGVSDKPRRAAD